MSNRLSCLFKPLLHSLILRSVAGLIVFYFLFSWLAVDPLARWLVPKIAESQLASKGSVGKVSFDPLRWILSVEQLVLTDKHGAPLAAFDTLIVDLESGGLLDRAWKLKQVQLVAPRINIEISKQGRLNWADLLAKLNEEPSPPDQALPRVILEHIAIQHGDINYHDNYQTRPLQASLKPLDFELDGFSTLPEDRGDYLIAARLPHQGGTIKWKGNFGVNPLASQGTLAIDGLQLAKLTQWLPADALPLQTTAGTLSSQFGYNFFLVNQKPELTLADIRLTLQTLAGQLKQGEQLSVDKAELRLQSLHLQQQTALTIAMQTLSFKLEQLQLRKSETAITLAAAQVSVPAVDLHQETRTQLRFDDLALQMAQLQLQHQQQSLFTLPALQVENVRLDLAEQQAMIGSVQLADAQLSATTGADGKLDWQQILVAASPATDTVASTEPADRVETDTDTATSVPPWQVDIANIALTHWQLHYLDKQYAKPLQARVQDFNLQFALAQTAGLQLDHIQSQLHQLSVHSDKQPVAQLGSLSLTDGQIALDAHTVKLGVIQLADLHTSVSRQADQRLNWQAVLTPSRNTTPQPTQPSPARQQKAADNGNPSLWTIALKRFALKQANLHLEDLTTPTPVKLDITDCQIDIADISHDMRRALPIKVGFKVKQGGHFHTQGKLAPAPFKADLTLRLSDLALKPFAAYIQQVALLELQDGSASIQGTLHHSAAGNTRFDGGFGVQHWALLEEASQQPFLTWQRLQGDGLTLSLAPNKMHLDTLTLTQPQSKFIIFADRSLNISKVLRASQPSAADARTIPASTPPNAAAQTASAATTATPANDPGFPVGIDTVRILDANLEFADLSLPQPFGTHIHSLGGVINGISTDPAARTQIELDGKVDEYGSARIRGALQPFDATTFTDIRLAFTNLEMNRLTPYSGKFAGRKIESGKLSVDLEYKIKQRKLAGENKFVIQKLTLGERVDSKDAPNLPLDLAIAILEDSDGVIDLDLPVSGSLDDPSFSYGGVLWKAFTNVLTKIVTAPFAALGKLFGSNEKLEAITFEAGKAVITPPEQEKLQAVSKALAKRQQLKLGMTPGFATAADTRALQESTLRAQVAAEMGIQVPAGQAAGPVDSHNPKVQAALRTLHDRLTQKGLFKRLTAKLEKTPEGYYEQAQEALTTSIVVSDADLQALATARANAIQQYLQDAGLPPARMTAAAPVAVKAERDQVPTKLSLEAIKH